MPSRLVGKYLILFAGIFATGLSWPMMKVILTEATPIWLATARAAFSTLVVAFLLLARRELALPRRSDIPVILVVGIFQMAIFFGLTQLGLRQVGSGRAVVLAFTTSIWAIPLAVVFIHEKVSAIQVTGVLIGILGVGLLVLPGQAAGWGSAQTAGGLLLLAAAFSWAIAIVYLRKHKASLSALQLLPWQTAIASLILAFFALLFEGSGSLGHSLPVLTLMLLVSAVIGPLGSWTSLVLAQSLPVLVSSLSLLLVPVVGFLASAIWLGEHLTVPLVGGCAAIVVALLVLTLDRIYSVRRLQRMPAPSLDAPTAR